jgi:two-component system chemotaxis response regulator CheY
MADSTGENQQARDGEHTVLIVDDSRTARMVARKTLEKEGFVVIEAENGYAALDILRARKVDAIILDWNMPEMGGLETVGHIRDIGAHVRTPIVMATSEHDERKKTLAVAAGVDVWLTKPYSPADLHRVLVDILS